MGTSGLGKRKVYRVKVCQSSCPASSWKDSELERILNVNTNTKRYLPYK